MAENEMVEKVRDAALAEIIRQAHVEGDFITDEGGGCLWHDGKLDGSLIARAAIEAMRIPTDAVMNAGRESFRSNGLLPAYTDSGASGQTPIMDHMLREAWPLMIDAALTPETGK